MKRIKQRVRRHHDHTNDHDDDAASVGSTQSSSKNNGSRRILFNRSKSHGQHIMGQGGILRRHRGKSASKLNEGAAETSTPSLSQTSSEEKEQKEQAPTRNVVVKPLMAPQAESALSLKGDFSSASTATTVASDASSPEWPSSNAPRSVDKERIETTRSPLYDNALQVLHDPEAYHVSFPAVNGQSDLPSDVVKTEDESEHLQVASKSRSAGIPDPVASPSPQGLHPALKLVVRTGQLAIRVPFLPVTLPTFFTLTALHVGFATTSSVAVTTKRAFNSVVFGGQDEEKAKGVGGFMLKIVGFPGWALGMADKLTEDLRGTVVGMIAPGMK